MKGAEKVRRQASTRNTPGLAAANSAEDLASNSAMIKLQEEMENLQKDIEKNQGDHTRLIKDLNEKNNDMQTAFENAKQSTTLAQKKYKDESDRYIEAEQELKKITKTISERQEQFNINQDRLKVKEREITKLSKIKDEKQAELDEHLKKVEEDKIQAKKIRLSMCDIFDLELHGGLNFVADATSFNSKQKSQLAAKK